MTLFQECDQDKKIQVETSRSFPPYKNYSEDKACFVRESETGIMTKALKLTSIVIVITSILSYHINTQRKQDAWRMVLIIENGIM